MVFMCQADSYLKEFKAKVTSCESKEVKIESNGKMVKTKGFEVELSDTILFPEGGGQPDDRGTINDVQVKKITRKGAKALHFVEHELEVGSEVHLKVDWKRRFEHMQQHSGQHLITAVADDKYGFKTTSWDLGKTISYIEMDTPTITLEQLEDIENIVNQAIRDCTPVEVHVTQVGSPLLDTVRTRGLPNDHVGDVRIVEMKGIEANMCCGTHVKNLSHLQCIKLLSVEKGKKGRTNIYFLAGERILSYVGKCYSNEKELTKHLKCGPEQHASSVERMIKQFRTSQKSTTTLLRDLAVLEAKLFNESESDEKFFTLHRKEGNNEFMNIIANEIEQEAFLFLTVGDEKGSGMFLLSGPNSFIEQCGAPVLNLIEGKGAAKNGRMQGKAVKLHKKECAVDYIKDYISTL